MPRRAAVDLLAQPADEHVDRAVAVTLTAPPQALQQLVARYDAALLERKRIEQSELGRRQLGARSVHERLYLIRVDAELLDLDRLTTHRLLRAPRRLAWAWTRATSSFMENGLTR